MMGNLFLFILFLWIFVWIGPMSYPAIARSIDCELEPGAHENTSIIRNLTEQVQFYHRNLTNTSLSVLYSWEVTDSDEQYDGFLYCVKDNSGREIEQFKDDENWSDVVNNESVDPDLRKKYLHCASYFGKHFWSTDANGTYHSCRFPCDPFVQCVPPVHSVCDLIADGYWPLSKHRRNLTIPIRFGQHYRFELIPFTNHKPLLKLFENSYAMDKVLVFCRHHLIESHGLPARDVTPFCELQQTISTEHAASGPVANVSVSKPAYDFDNNITTVTISWMKPHDVIMENPVYGYTTSNGFQVAKTKEEEKEDPFYRRSFNFSGINIQKTNEISIVPTVVKNCPSCENLGPETKVELDPEDFYYDPCVEKFCHNSSVCVFNQNNSRNYWTWCQCRNGFVGNGISKGFAEGAEGCVNFNACEPATECIPSAVCVDADPPSMGVKECKCPSSYEGDGRIRGSGCRHVVVIPAAVLATALFFALLAAAMFQYRKYHHKRRLLNSKLTLFVSKQPQLVEENVFINYNGLSSYFHSNNNHNNLSTEPVFGNKLEVARSRISELEIIGRGNFGVVHKALLRNDDGDDVIVAIKSLTGIHSSEYRNEFLSEISLLSYLGDHHNILGVMGVCTVQSCNGGELLSPLLITEYMVYGDLLHFLWNARDPLMSKKDSIYNLTEACLYKIGRQVALGLQHVCQSKVIHGDVAARNVLVGENLKVKISDFGLANDVYRYGLIKGAIEKKVPFKWVSPERMAAGKAPITWKSDVWSFGILLYEMVTLGATPYPGMEPLTIFQKLQSGYRIPQPTSCSDHLYKIMKRCWEWNATKRPSFKELEEKLCPPTSLNEAVLSKPLITRIHQLDEINRESYERAVKRRESLNVEGS